MKKKLNTPNKKTVSALNNVREGKTRKVNTASELFQELDKNKISDAPPWKTSLCCSGKKCWCRCISTVNSNNTGDDLDDCIIASGGVSKDNAEIIVKSVNNHEQLINTLEEIVDKAEAASSGDYQSNGEDVQGYLADILKLAKESLGKIK